LEWKKEKEKTQLCAAVFFYPQKIIDKNLGIFFPSVNCKFDQFSKIWGKSFHIFPSIKKILIEKHPGT
jgi:hypothetical protein